MRAIAAADLSVRLPSTWVTMMRCIMALNDRPRKSMADIAVIFSIFGAKTARNSSVNPPAQRIDHNRFMNHGNPISRACDIDFFHIDVRINEAGK